MKSLKDVKAQLLANPAVRQAYDAQAPEFELARELIAARMKAGLTQGDVAARMGTTQSVVARIESGRGTPSMRTVQRFANAVGARAVVRMEPLTTALIILGRLIGKLVPIKFTFQAVAILVDTYDFFLCKTNHIQQMKLENRFHFFAQPK